MRLAQDVYVNSPLYTQTKDEGDNVELLLLEKSNTSVFFFLADDSIRDNVASRGLGDVYK